MAERADKIRLHIGLPGKEFGIDGGVVEPTADATTFTLPNRVNFGVSYGVAVLAQPAGETCSVSANGTAVIVAPGGGDKKKFTRRKPGKRSTTGQAET